MKNKRKKKNRLKIVWFWILCTAYFFSIYWKGSPCLVCRSETNCIRSCFDPCFLMPNWMHKPLKDFYICKTSVTKMPETLQGKRKACGRSHVLLRFISSLYALSFSHSVFLQVSAWLRIALQTQVLLLRQGAAVVLWESIHTLVLLLNPGYVNHEQTSLTHNDSPQFNCVTGLIQGIMTNVCEGEYVRRWLRHLIDF